MNDCLIQDNVLYPIKLFSPLVNIIRPNFQGGFVELVLNNYPSLKLYPKDSETINDLFYTLISVVNQFCYVGQEENQE